LQKDLTEMKIFLQVLGGGGTFLKHPVGLEDTFWICLCFSVIALSTSHKSLVIFML